MDVALIIVGAIVLLNLIGFIISKILGRNELQGINPCGKLVEVSGKRMHVYANGNEGNGKETIILLPGLNVILPSVDFKPLMDELSVSYNVVSVEYFGYGFSDETNTPRTNENYVEEIRQTLTTAGFKPPYILMPYSASGIYAEYYAAKYPQEVKALILLDTTSSAEKDTTTPPRWVFGITKLQQATGFTRITNPLLLPKVVGITVENGYTEKDIKNILKFANHVYNETLINQNVSFPTCVDEVIEMDFPTSVPVLAIRADTYSKGKWPKYISDHMKKLGKNAESTVIAGSSHASIYHNHKHRKSVCEAVEQFLEQNDYAKILI